MTNINILTSAESERLIKRLIQEELNKTANELSNLRLRIIDLERIITTRVK